MSDRPLESAKEPWQRVRWARERVFDSAEAAAEALGIPGSTYRQYERGPGSSRYANLDEDYAKTFGRKFKVNWVWLLTGFGNPSGDVEEVPGELVEIYRRLGAPQQQLLIDLARNMSGQGDNVVAVDSLPSAPSARRSPRKTG